MVSGDLTVSTIDRRNQAATFRNLVNSMNLPAVTDNLLIFPIPGRDRDVVACAISREA